MDFLRLFADLRLDRVLSLGQVRRRFAPGHDEDDVRSAIVWAVAARRLTTWLEWVALTARARTIRRVDFVALRPLSTTSTALRHHCGIAEVRWRLGARVRAWDAACAPNIGRDEHPDAIAEALHGLLAVEYDAGSYSSEQIQEKAHTFHVVFGQQIWGAPSAARVQWLRARLPEGTEVLLAPWW